MTSIALLFTSLAAVSSLAADSYVSPKGTPDADGTIDSPWDLGTALRQPAAVQPGDTVWLRGGAYRGTFTSRLTGAGKAPIVVRQYPGERATIDGGSSRNSPLTVNGAWTWYWGFEVINSDPARVVKTPGSDPPELRRGTGINVFGPNTKFINLIVHDTAQGFGFWTQARDAEMYGNIIYYNGWDAPDRGHGHAIYTQNQTGAKRIVDNILFGQFGYGVHAYGSPAAYLNSFYLEGNIAFNNGVLSRTSGFSTNILVGGGRIAENTTLIANHTYFTPAAGRGSNNLGYSAGCRGLEASDNYFAGGTALTLIRCEDVAMTGNTFYGRISGFTQSQFPDNTYYSERPKGSKLVIRPNQYEPGRAHIVIYNWSLQDEIAIDGAELGLAIGDGYEIRNVQNYFKDIISGSYDGSPLRICMKKAGVAEPVGYDAPPSTLPELGVFVFTRKSNAGFGR
jgi:hypothetical protein